MILAIVLVIASVLALAFIFIIAVSRSLQVSAKAPAPHVQPIDIQAFRNLVDPAETDYLRRRLSAADFRAVQRKRLLAMAGYVEAAGKNALILITLGNSALSSSDPHTAEAAHQLVDHGMLLRRNALFALMKIRAAWVWPNSSLGVSPILVGYERLNGSAMLLGRLQNPAAPIRISAVL
jgi:hypothetical protein